MTSIEDIERTIENYGYLLVKPKKIRPSYYRIIDDGTIIEALIRIESIVQSEGPAGYGVKTSNSVKSYVPREKRKPSQQQSAQPQPNELVSGTIEEDIKSDELSSEFSEYEISDGTTVSIRTIVNQINKTKFYSPDGEPIYSVITTPVIKIIGKK
jgi:hypothetical protein